MSSQPDLIQAANLLDTTWPAQVLCEQVREKDRERREKREGGLLLLESSDS